MRVAILALSVLGILVSADAAKAGPSTATRYLRHPRSPGRYRRSNPGNRGSDRPRQGQASRRAALADRSRLRQPGSTESSTSRPAPSSPAGREHAAIPRPAFSTRCSIRRCWPKTSRRRTPTPAAATIPVTTIRPIVAVGWCPPSPWRWRSRRPDRRRDGRAVRRQVTRRPLERASGNSAAEPIPRPRLIAHIKHRETAMNIAKIILAGIAVLTISSAALAQQALTGTVTEVDRSIASSRLGRPKAAPSEPMPAALPKSSRHKMACRWTRCMLAIE